MTRPDVACMWRSWEGGSSPPPIPPYQGAFLGASCPSVAPRGLISGIVPLFIFMDNFVCPPPALRCSQKLGAVPSMLPPGARCDVTPVEGAGEWNWSEQLFPGAQGHSYEPSEPRTVEWKERGKCLLERENRWEKSRGVQAKFVFWLEVWSGSNLLSLCASCPSGSSAAVPLPGLRDSAAEPGPGGGLCPTGALTPSSTRYTQPSCAEKPPRPRSHLLYSLDFPSFY